MSLKINLTKKELRIADRLYKDTKEWSDLSFDEKLVLYECPMGLGGLVEPQEMEEFEDELAMKGYFGTTGMVRSAVKQATGELMR